MFPPKLIVCPTDFSEGSFQALTEASALASHFAATICMVHVTPVLPETGELGVFLNVPEYQDALHEDAERKLCKIAESLAAKGLPTKVVVGNGDAATEIVRIAREQGADMVVIATHGNSGWRHLAFGSVAEKVLRLAACPVLTIRIAEHAPNVQGVAV